MCVTFPRLIISICVSDCVCVCVCVWACQRRFQWDKHLSYRFCTERESIMFQTKVGVIVCLSAHMLCHNRCILFPVVKGKNSNQTLQLNACVRSNVSTSICPLNQQLMNKCFPQWCLNNADISARIVWLTRNTPTSELGGQYSLFHFCQKQKNK